jgi:hypothetical protein
MGERVYGFARVHRLVDGWFPTEARRRCLHLIRTLRSAIDRVVVMEPNADHVMRKLLEFTPSYRAAGEDSFGASHNCEICLNSTATGCVT